MTHFSGFASKSETNWLMQPPQKNARGLKRDCTIHVVETNLQYSPKCDSTEHSVRSGAVLFAKTRPCNYTDFFLALKTKIFTGKK